MSEESSFREESPVKYVRSLERFADYLEQLRLTLLNDPDSWQNLSLPDYLESVQAWVLGMDRSLENLGIPASELDAIPRCLVAEIFDSGKYYE